jgi:hypothetical protein
LADVGPDAGEKTLKDAGDEIAALQQRFDLKRD